MRYYVRMNLFVAVICSDGRVFLIPKGHRDRFALNESITRAEFTTLLVRSLGLSIENTAISSFIDVDEEAWYADAIEAAVKAELVHGAADHFVLDNNITREQMAVVQAIESGIINGLTEDTIAPSDYATRVQATVMLKRFLIHVGFID